MLLCFLYGSNLQASIANDSLKKEAYRLISEGNKAEYRNSYAEAESIYLKALEIWGQIPEYDEYRAYPYYSLAVLYGKIGNYQRSLDFYYKAESILLNAREEYKYLLSAIYKRMGDLFVEYGDYSKALLYFDKSLEIVKNKEARNESTYSNSIFGIAQTYYFQHDYQRSIDLCKSYLSQNNALQQNQFHRLIGRCYIAQGKYGDAIEIFTKALSNLKDQPEKYTEVLLTTTNAYIRSGDLITSEEYLNKAKQLLAENKPKIDPWQIYYYELMGEFLMRKADQTLNASEKKPILCEAMKSIDNALLMNSAGKEKNKIPYIETKGRFIIPTQVKDLMINRAKVLSAIADSYYENEDKISGRQFQLLALKTWEATIHFLHDFRISFLEEESKLALSELQSNVYTEGFALAGKLFRETGNKEYFQKMLFFSESGKSSTFLASLNTAQAKSFGGIPDSLLIKEKELNMQVSSMNQMIFNAKNSPQPDTLLLLEWEKNLFNAQRQLDELMFRFENEFPNYYSFKYSDKLISHEEIISKLTRNQALVEYVVDEPVDENDKGSVNILFFTKSGFRYYSTEINYNYVTNLKTVLEQLSNLNVGETNLNDFKKFIRSSNYLYSVLIEPIKFENSVSELTIIPDGKLAYLPFDALIQTIPDSLHISFSSPDYLIRRFSLVYSYSATLHYDYFRKQSGSNSKILAFAPNYNGGEIDINQAAYRARQISRTSMRPLPGAKEEVIGLSQHFKCKAYIDNDAKEQTFKEEAGKYGILHLAMHTIMNDSIPMYSKLVFASTPDSSNDGFLNTQEIYNMKLNARLAVLSACNTGSGKMRTGEGVMSMARAFLYAGCPSIVMTLWEVEDRSSAALVLDFYRYLFKGYSKPEALRLAKLEYLSKADPYKSHPYFWMGYIVIGDPSPIKYHTTVFALMLAFAFILSIVLIFWKRILKIIWDKEKK